MLKVCDALLMCSERLIPLPPFFFQHIVLGCSAGVKPQTGFLPQPPAALRSCRPAPYCAGWQFPSSSHLNSSKSLYKVELKHSCRKRWERHRPSDSAAIACGSKLLLIWFRLSPSILEPTELLGPPFVLTSYSHSIAPQPSLGFLPSLLVVNVPQDGGWLHSISQISTRAWMRQMRDWKTLLWLCKAGNGFSPRYIRPLYYQPLRAFRSSGTSLPLCPQSQN